LGRVHSERPPPAVNRKIIEFFWERPLGQAVGGGEVQFPQLPRFRNQEPAMESRRPTCRPAFESLETRACPATVLTAVLAFDGVLDIEGTELADVFAVRHLNGEILVGTTG
jgi:hypothetical protein